MVMDAAEPRNYDIRALSLYPSPSHRYPLSALPLPSLPPASASSSKPYASPGSPATFPSQTGPCPVTTSLTMDAKGGPKLLPGPPYIHSSEQLHDFQLFELLQFRGTGTCDMFDA